MHYYKIKNIPGLNGLIIKGNRIELNVNYKDESTEHNDGPIVEVEQLINERVVIGDRQFVYPVPLNTVYIGINALEPIDDPKLREWTAENPFGEFKHEGHYKSGDILVDYAVYENGMSVNVKDTGSTPAKTIFSQNYFGAYEIAEANESIEDALAGETDVEDLIFDLEALAAGQKDTVKE